MCQKKTNIQNQICKPMANKYSKWIHCISLLYQPSTGLEVKMPENRIVGSYLGNLTSEMHHIKQEKSLVARRELFVNTKGILMNSQNLLILPLKGHNSCNSSLTIMGIPSARSMVIMLHLKFQQNLSKTTGEERQTKLHLLTDG